jgi:hypothetical protein
LWLELFDGFVQRVGRLVLRSAGDGGEHGRETGLLLPRLALLLSGFAVLRRRDDHPSREARLLLSRLTVLLPRFAVLRRLVLPGWRLLPGRPMLWCNFEVLRLEKVVRSE